MIKVLYISAVSNKISGGSSVTERNLELIKKVPGIDLRIYKVPMQGKAGAFCSLLLGGNLILSRSDEKKLINIVNKEHFDYVFQEGTTSGHLAQSLVEAGVNLIVFAHNVETLLYRERFYKNRLNILEALKYSLVKRNEKKSVGLCTSLIALTKRDSNNFSAIFRRGADFIIPISFQSVKLKENNIIKKERYCLFVGSNFFPNNEGVTWFITNVAPYIKYKLKVVGSCCDALSPIIIDGNVELLGIVDDLSSMYLDAQFVIVPLFKGSGMKTKTIEAMSYGKTIFGTDECFQGIECDYDKIGGLCNTDKEFIEKINNYSGSTYNEYTKALFEECYSNDAVQEKFDTVFNSKVDE